MEHPNSSHRRTIDPPTLQAQASGDLDVSGFRARSWSHYNHNPSWGFSGPLFLLTFNLSLKVSEIHSVVSNSLRPHALYVHGILQARILESVAFSFSRDLPNPGIEPRSPALQADSLPAEPRRKPKNTGVGSLSLLQHIYMTQKLNRGLLHWDIREVNRKPQDNRIAWNLKTNVMFALGEIVKVLL